MAEMRCSYCKTKCSTSFCSPECKQIVMNEKAIAAYRIADKTKYKRKSPMHYKTLQSIWPKGKLAWQ